MESVTTVVAIVIVLLLSSLILQLMLPGFVTYTITSQTSIINGDLAGRLTALVSNGSLDLISYIILFTTLAYGVIKRFYNRQTLIYPLIQLSMLFNGIILLLSLGSTKIGSYYMLPVYPLLLASFMVLWRKSPKVFALAAIITVVYPSIFGNPLIYKDVEFEMFSPDSAKVVEYGLHFIPPQKGPVLTEGFSGYEKIFSRYNTSINPDEVVLLNVDSPGYTIREDPIWGPKIRKMIDIKYDYGQGYESLTSQQTKVKDDILSGKYSMIMFGPPDWSNILTILKTIQPYIREKYCVVKVPNYMWGGDGLYMTNILFSNQEDCDKMNQDLTKYYSTHLKEICALGGKAEYVVKDTAERSGYSIYGSCTD